MRQKCILKLSQGASFEGRLIGAPLVASGELVFTTGMVGYSEALTDPSYFGQILTFAYPLIGNYGIPSMPVPRSWPVPKGFESDRVHAAAAIVTVDSPVAYHWNSIQSLDLWLKEQGVPGIVGLDTRHLVQLIRSGQGILGRVEPEAPEGEKIQLHPLKNDEFFDPGRYQILDAVSVPKVTRVGNGKVRIGLVDCGVKWNIVRQLLEFGCEVEILPWATDLEKVDCTGFLLSNGPGDPSKTGDLAQRVARLIEGRRPILGICLGHQILSRAAGAVTSKMDYGHRSHNQPVYEVGTRKGYITSQNHGYVVDDKSLSPDWGVWFRNVNDDSVEGIYHRSKSIRSIQFHPEAAGGPRDTAWILENFVSEVKKSWHC